MRDRGHRELGPGLLESMYESALCIELKTAGLAFARQVGVPVYYRGALISEHRPDLVVTERVIVEVKSVERLHPVHRAQMIAYLRIMHLKLGLLLNFNRAILKHGIRRVMN